AKTAEKPEVEGKSAASSPPGPTKALPPPVPPESLALLYLSRWDSPESAARFADFYAGALLKRYRFAQAEDEPLKPAATPSLRRKWTTDAGPVFSEQRGEWVLALEGFDDATAAKLADGVLAGAKVVPTKP